MARDFNGSTANHITPGDISPNFPTVAAFIELDSIAQYAVAGKWTSGFGQLSFLLETTGTGKIQFAVNVPPILVVTGTTTMSTGTRYHVAGSYDGSVLTVYLNGVVDATNAAGSGFTVNTGGSYEIGYRSSGGFSFDGGLAEVATWLNPLLPEEIAALAGGVSPARHPRDLLSFCPLWGVDDPEVDLVQPFPAVITGTVPQRDTPLHAGQPWGFYG